MEDGLINGVEDDIHNDVGLVEISTAYATQDNCFNEMAALGPNSGLNILAMMMAD